MSPALIRKEIEGHENEAAQKIIPKNKLLCLRELLIYNDA